MLIKAALSKGIEIFKSNNNEAPAVEAGVILCHVIKKNKTFLYTHGEYELSKDEETLFFNLAEQRLKGVPVQYLTGQQEFMSLEFAVGPDVLIPRHDTEVLVESVISSSLNHASLEEKGKKFRILDIGTGSGCIAVSLAYYLKNSNVTAVDISEGALKVAKSNALKNNVADSIAFMQSDIFSALEKSRSFEIIVSNPPYICRNEIDALQIEVGKYEPKAALDGGIDGLDFYRRIIEEAPEYLKKDGLLAFETGYDQAQVVAKMMNKNFYNINIIKDLAGIERVVLGRLRQESI